MKHLISHQDRRDGTVIVKVLLPFLGICLIAAYFHEFVLNAINANKAINLLIITAATYGVFLIVNRAIGAISDFRTIERFGHEASQGVYMGVLLEQPWLKKRYVRHYLSHIARTGGTLSSQLDQNAIENELHALQGEFDSKLELPQFLVGFMIAMGLLGTFIGLLETLTGISGMLDNMGAAGSNPEEQFMKLVVELRKPLAGMGIAFSASMFGLITSLMLAIMMTNLRRYISRVISLARNVMHELTEMTRAGTASDGSSRSLSPDDIAKMAAEKPASTAGGGGNIANTLIVGRFDILTQKIQQLIENFDEGVAATQKTNELLSFGPRMKELSERNLEELKTLSARTADQQRFFQSLIEVNQDTVAAIKSLADTQNQVRSSSVETVHALKALSQDIGDHRQIARQMLDVETGAAKTAANLLNAQKDAQSELSGLLRNLAEKLGASEEIHLGSARHLFEVKENFIKLCKSLGVLDLIAAGVSGQSLLLETIVEETRTSQRTLEAMQQDIHGQVDRSS